MRNRSAIRLPGVKRKSGPFNGGDYRTVAAWSQPVRAVPGQAVTQRFANQRNANDEQATAKKRLREA